MRSFADKISYMGLDATKQWLMDKGCVF